MTCCTARAAGVPEVVAASPCPTEVTKGAAFVAGADCLLVVGGAHAIAAMAHGVGVKPCDIIVGPGNKWVTAAKSIVNGICGIDMLAGPSEVLVLADKSADAEVIAADLLAQAMLRASCERWGWPLLHCCGRSSPCCPPATWPSPRCRRASPC
ncbi:unnamed protein product [Prorocentrum cordatum]|uniref:Histidinol dehydrogenase n=1 Tax=Prorocentrum cordatum TaxID=2364126 RepID=A0ABN9WI13_9DINO|nr:unnamed protein product [Polarella glacialis]